MPSGTPVTNEGLQDIQEESGKVESDAHHGHGMIVVAQADLEFIEESSCELYECFWSELKLAMYVVEDRLGIGALDKLSGYRGHGRG